MKKKLHFKKKRVVFTQKSPKGTVGSSLYINFPLGVAKSKKYSLKKNLAEECYRPSPVCFFDEGKVDEKYIEKHFVKAVRDIGGIAVKFTSPSYSGMPDRLVLLPGGKAFFAELKAPGRKTRALQDSRIGMLRGFGFKVFVIDSVSGIQEALYEIQGL